MKIYLGGPRGRINYPLFNIVARWLRSHGTHVFNPAETEHTEAERRKCFAEDCKFICEEADALVMLPNWHQSKGACAEAALATALGLPIYEYKPGDDGWQPYLTCKNHEAWGFAVNMGFSLTIPCPVVLAC